jgi:bile acid:Na+ symporter, BASS family
MKPQAVIMLTLQISIILTVFGFGLRANLDDVLCLVRQPKILLLSLIAMFVIMPLFAVLVTGIFPFTAAVTVALIALSISPVPPLLPRRITKSAGVSPYGIGLMVTAASLSIIFIPLATFLIGKYFHRPFVMEPLAVAKMIFPTVLLPLALGILVHRLAPAFAERIAHPLTLFANILLLLGGLCVLIFALPSIWELVGNGTILAFAAFIFVGLMAGHLLGGQDPDERVPLALSTACRHPALAIAIAKANVPAEKNVLSAVLLYLLLNAVLTVPYVKWQRKQAAGAADGQSVPLKAKRSA